jgi:hypothetical protein
MALWDDIRSTKCWKGNGRAYPFGKTLKLGYDKGRCRKLNNTFLFTNEEGTEVTFSFRLA